MKRVFATIIILLLAAAGHSRQPVLHFKPNTLTLKHQRASLRRLHRLMQQKPNLLVYLRATQYPYQLTDTTLASRQVNKVIALMGRRYKADAWSFEKGYFEDIAPDQVTYIMVLKGEGFAYPPPPPINYGDQ